jgi:hypothetical protein
VIAQGFREVFFEFVGVVRWIVARRGLRAAATIVQQPWKSPCPPRPPCENFLGFGLLGLSCGKSPTEARRRRNARTEVTVVTEGFREFF